MSSRLTAAFDALREANRPGLVTYTAAGDPDLSRSAEVLRALDRAGADVLEVGVPFSDPMADGPVIQRATERAIAAGSNLSATLDIIGRVRSDVKAPIVLFSYANPLLRMGTAEVARRAAAAGVDGVLALDLPIEEAGEFQRTMDAARLDTIFLLSPTTTDERIQKAARLGRGFLYGISRLGVTGARDQVAAGAEAMVRRIRAFTSLPIALGFGISRPEHVAEVGGFADAAVVGSALVALIEKESGSPALVDRVEEYVRSLRAACRPRGTRSVGAGVSRPDPPEGERFRG